MIKRSEKVLTVVVPVYNTERYIKRCLDSLTYNIEALEKVEVLVVSDGSRDGSVGIAREYENKFPASVKIVEKENGGHGSTINTGLGKARGKYFCVVDSDDWVNIDDFPLLIARLEMCEADLVLTRYAREEVWWSESIVVEYKNVPYDKTIRADTFDYSRLGKFYFNLANSFYMTKMLRDAGVRIDEKCFYADMEYVVFPMRYVESFVYLDLDVYRYFIGRPEQSVSMAGMQKNRKDHGKVLRKIIECHKEMGEGDKRRDYVWKVACLMCATHYEIFLNGASERTFAKEIREFDRYLKKNAPDIYEQIVERHVRLNRKTNFVLANMQYNLLTYYVKWGVR